MSQAILPRRRAEEFRARNREGVPAEILAEASDIVERVRSGGEEALREYTTRFGDCLLGKPLYLTGAVLTSALEELPGDARTRLERIADRIRTFAQSQLAALTPVDNTVPGGRIGHRIDPVEGAGCYAPGGRHPLPSSVLMTALTARVAGVPSVWVASPNPAPITLAAAAVAGADGVLAAGGAHAIAALAFGVGPIPPSDVVVGPGNLYVTAAKQLLAGQIKIDMLAGPSELVVVADATADPAWVAADLLAQAEHDPDAVPILISIDAELPSWVEKEIERQLEDLPTADTARAALANGGVIVCETEEDACLACDDIAPEHLHLSVSNAESWPDRLHHYGALFIGWRAAEVFGDYGVGPNHVLPTGGTARARGGLSVMDFLRVRTWIQADSDLDPELIEDVAWFARQEGLEAHARAAEIRRGQS
ncbi:MAG: histidinol dehydrogenase [Gemmatimonadetes bacterium]|nr:histidinol dehydrogenase [Gemmatimonadota bacterium]